MGVRVLLLAIVVIGAVPPSVTSAASSAPAAALSNTGNGEGSGAGLCELAGCCDGCLADPDEAARPIAHVLPNLSYARAFAAIGDPFTEERVRLPFRPPMAR